MNDSPSRPDALRLFLLIAAMLLVGGILAAWWGGAFAPGRALSPRPTASSAADLASAELDAARREPAAARTADVGDRAAEAQALEPARTWTVTGRCVDEAGTPLLGVSVRAWLGAEEEPPLEASSALWSTTTDGEGRFRLEAAVDGVQDGQLRCEAEGRVPLRGQLRRPMPGEAEDLGDLVMHAAVAVAGTVVDTKGEPVAGVRVMFVRIDLTAAPRPIGVGADASAEESLIAFSGADGRFGFDLPAWAGEWFIGAEYTGPLVEPRNVQLDGSLSEFDLRIVVERPDPATAVTGKVVDDIGRPVPGAKVVLTGHGFIGRALSDDEGNVVVGRAGPLPRRGRTGMNVDVDHDSALYEWPDASRASDLEWGARDVEFRLVRRASRDIRVVDSRGMPVEDYVLHAYSDRRGGVLTRYARIRVRGHHPDGRCTLAGLYRGRQGVIVVPDDPRLASTEVVSFEVDGAAAGPEQLVVVPDVAEFGLEVVTGTGDPVRGSRVELIQRLMPGTVGVETRAVPLADADRSRSIERALVVASASTDESGHALLSAPPGTWDLRILGPGHVDHVEQVFVGAGVTRLRVVVQVGGTVRGRIGPPAAIAELAALRGSELFVDLDPAAEDLPTIELPVGADGRCEASGLPAGEYDVSVRIRYESSEFQVATDTHTVGRRSLTDGSLEEFDLDVSAGLPVPVSGRVTVDGAPLGGVHCFLKSIGVARFPMLRIGTDADGRFQALVRPAEYRLVTTMPARPGPGWVRVPVHDRSWRIGSGGDTWIDASIHLRRATLHLVDAQGKPLVDTTVRVSAPDYGDPTEKRTGSDGSVRIDPAPAGEFHVVVGTGPEPKRVGPYSLPPGAMDGEITVRVE